MPCFTSYSGIYVKYEILTGDPFEAAKGTRGMMERWKGARKARNGKEMSALLASPGDMGGLGAGAASIAYIGKNKEMKRNTVSF
jgi:hypothetical protein